MTVLVEKKSKNREKIISAKKTHDLEIEELKTNFIIFQENEDYDDEEYEEEYGDEDEEDYDEEDEEEYGDYFDEDYDEEYGEDYGDEDDEEAWEEEDYYEEEYIQDSHIDRGKINYKAQKLC